MPADPLSVEILEAVSALRSAIWAASNATGTTKEKSENRRAIKEYEKKQAEWLKGQRPGVAKERVQLEALVRTVAEWKLAVDVSGAEALLAAGGKPVAPEAVVTGEPVRPASITESERRKAESLAAWDRFHQTELTSDNLEVWLRWALKAATAAKEPGYDFPLWQKVTEPCPDLVAISYADAAFKEPAKVLGELTKLLRGGGDDDLIRREKKRESALLQMLTEFNEEVAKNGVNAYA